MIIISILSILQSNAVNTKRDISILYNRIAILILIYCMLNNLYSIAQETKALGIQGGLLLVTNITQKFNIFLFMISIFILTLTSFYPRKVSLSLISKTLKDVLTSVLNKVKSEYTRLKENSPQDIPYKINGKTSVFKGLRELELHLFKLLLVNSNFSLEGLRKG